jgi:putative transposase
VALARCLDSHRELYNAALQERRDAYELGVRREAHYFGPKRAKCSVRYTTQSAQLKEIRRLRPDVATWSFSSEQATLRRLNKAFESFFRRLGAAETPGFPRFKSAYRFDSVEWPKDGDGCRWHPDASRVYLQGIGHVKVSLHRKVGGTVKTVSVKREGRKWYLVLSCDEVPQHLLEPTGALCGIDLGIESFLVTSGGDREANPRHARQAADSLASAQQILSRKKRGSKNRVAARETAAARHRKVRAQRLDFHHKTARKLVKEYDVICHEDLVVKNMVKRARPEPDPDNPGQFLPNGASAKTGLNRSINDVGWAQFLSILRAKAEDAGRTVIAVNPRYTSTTCHECGHVELANRVTQAKFCCRACGHVAHADENAACNIFGAGLALLVAPAA